MTKNKTKKTDYDSPWKEVLEYYFQQAMEFYFPEVYEGIDWSREYEFLDKELQKVVRAAESGQQHVDKLVKVFLKNGEEAWVLVHVEVQGQYEIEFASRMYRYNYRIYDRYNRQVLSLAILTDDRLNWRPNGFGYELLGFKINMEFPIVKLLDYEQQWSKLEQHANPFAIVTMAHISAIRTKRESEDRLKSKISLVKLLYERRYSREQVLELLRFIDWILELPKGLENKLEQTILEYEEERKMKYVTSWERMGIEKGSQQSLLKGIALGLELRFGDEGLREMPEIKKITDIDVLNAILERIKTLTTISELRKMYRPAA